MSDLLARLTSALDGLGVRDGRALVAVSGGPDSLALLDLVATLGPDRDLEPVVAHFDHGIHPGSASVAERVVAAAASYRLTVVVGRGFLGANASETRARRARLHWLETVRREQDAQWIMTAHHRDDQVETIVMRFLEGSGPAGLAGIAAKRGPWVRPLLDVDRRALADHLQRIGVAAWDDPANSDPRHLRGWVRATLLPVLETRLPRLRRNLLVAREAAEEQRRGWDELLKETPSLEFRSEASAASVAAAPLSGYSSGAVRGLVRALGYQLGAGVGRRQLDRVQRLLAQGHTGQRVDLKGGYWAELAFGRLRLFRPAPHPGSYGLAIVARAGVWELEGWRIRVENDLAPVRMARGGFVTWLEAEAPLLIRPWLPGDRVRPLRGRGARLVVRCMQDERIPRSLRPGWPVVVHDGEVIWVPGVCRSDTKLPTAGTESVRIDVSPR